MVGVLDLLNEESVVNTKEMLAERSVEELKNTVRYLKFTRILFKLVDPLLLKLKILFRHILFEKITFVCILVTAKIDSYQNRTVV